MTRRGPSLFLLVVLAGLFSPALGDAVLGDITIPRAVDVPSNSTPLAVFSHWKHRMSFKCSVCHETLFQMKVGADHITMDAVRDGQYCAVCHDGKTAFEVGFDTCEVCHSAATAGAN